MHPASAIMACGSAGSRVRHILLQLKWLNVPHPISYPWFQDFLDNFNAIRAAQSPLLQFRSLWESRKGRNHLRINRPGRNGSNSMAHTPTYCNYVAHVRIVELVRMGCCPDCACRKHQESFVANDVLFNGGPGLTRRGFKRVN